MASTCTVNRKRVGIDGIEYGGEMSRQLKNWTEQELAEMKRMAEQGMTLPEIAEAMGRSEWGVYTKLRRTTKPKKGQRNKGKQWHASDTVRIANYRRLGYSWERIAKEMQRTVDGVKSFYSTYVPNPRPEWTGEQVAFLVMVMEDERSGSMAQRYAWAAHVLDRDVNAVRMKYLRLKREQQVGQKRVDAGCGESMDSGQDSTPTDGRLTLSGDAGILRQPIGEGDLD